MAPHALAKLLSHDRDVQEALEWGLFANLWQLENSISARHRFIYSHARQKEMSLRKQNAAWMADLSLAITRAFRGKVSGLV